MKSNIDYFVWTRRFFVLLLLIVAASIFLYRISYKSMWLDEIYHREIGKRTIQQLYHAEYTYMQLGHLYYAMNRWGENLFGDMDFACRFPQAVATVLVVLFAYLLGRNLFSTGAGFLAGILCIFNYTMVYYAQENRFYQFSCLGLLSTYYFFIRYLETRKLLFLSGFILAMSFFLRANNIGVLIFALFGLFTFLLYFTSLLSGKKNSTYPVDFKTMLIIGASALIIILLWTPIPGIMIKHVLAHGIKGDTRTQFESQWRSYQGLSIPAICVYIRTHYLSWYFRLSPWLLTCIGVSMVAGSVIYKKGKALFFFIFCAIVTIVLFHTMNLSKASVFPKRVLYLYPVFAILVAVGVAGAIEIICLMIKNLFLRIPYLCKSNFLRVSSVRLLRVFLWIFLVKVFIWSDISQNAYSICQYYYKEKACYKLYAKVLSAHMKRTDCIWWSPYANNSYLIEAYLPQESFVKLINMDNKRITRKLINENLNQYSSLWLYGINPANYGFSREQYLDLKYSKNGKLYLIKSSYLTNNVARIEDEEMILKTMLCFSDFPLIRILNNLTSLLIEQKKQDIADKLVDKYERKFVFSPQMCDFANKYFEKQGADARAASYIEKHADLYFWHEPSQIKAAESAFRIKDYNKAIKYAKRAKLIGGDKNGNLTRIIGMSYFELADYKNASSWLKRTLSYKKYKKNKKVQNAYQKCQKILATSYEYLVFLLNDWNYSKSVSKMDDIIDFLTVLNSDGNRCKKFVKEAQLKKSKSPDIFLLVQALKEKENTNKLYQTLIQLKKSVASDYWPVYFYSINTLATTNWYHDLIVPVNEFEKLGFQKLSKISWKDALWFKDYYLKFGGSNCAIDFLKTWKTATDNIVYKGEAIVQQALIEKKNKNEKAVIKRLKDNYDILKNNENKRIRSINLLNGIKAKNANELLKRFENKL